MVKMNLRKEKGITLVALVITIIVLLILAGVTLNIVLNSGIINKSQTATSKYNEQATKEKLTLALTEYKFKQLAGDSQSLESIIQNIGGEVTSGTDSTATEWTIDLDGFTFTVNKATHEITNIEPSNSTPLEAPEIGTKTFTIAPDTHSATIKVTATAKNGGILTVTIDNKTATLVGSEYTAIVNSDGNKTITVTETVGNKNKTATTTITVTGIVQPTPASKETTGDGYVGCYADIDGNGTIDGIIYVDLLVRKPISGIYGANGSYTIPTDVDESNVKDYVVSANQITDERFEKSGAASSTYTPRYVISPASTTIGTKDRFYVMGLNDITDGTNSTLYWYKNAYDRSTSTGKMNKSDTSTNFGTGKTNTEAMLNIYYERNGKTKYADQDNRDLWKNIDTQVSQGWFIPSRGEWAAFGNALEINRNNYGSFGLYAIYWSSSINDNAVAWRTTFSSTVIDAQYVDQDYGVRLSVTF